MNSENDVIIGLEVHVQLNNLKTKLFCSCSTDYRGKEPNTHVCPICLGLPGSLPVINEKAIEFATKVALALQCEINERFWFFRKNYFYPDMAKNFQISQYNKAGGRAFGNKGHITIKINGVKKDILLNRIHLEEDPARIVHFGSIITSPYTLVDYNRSGITLLEIVTEPLINSPEEAREFLNQLKLLIEYTGVSNLDLEGSCRVDANISIKGYPRVEVKNINSFKEVESALKWEITRQKNLIKRNQSFTQETRHWDGKVTIPLRTKEFEKDYRYFPEQDLVPIELTQEYIEKIRKTLPEMPNERFERLRKQYQLSEFDAENLILNKSLADFYEEGVNLDPSFGPEEYKLYCNWLMNDVLGWLNDHKVTIDQTRLKPHHLVDLIKYLQSGKITSKIAKTLTDEIMKGIPLEKILKKHGKVRIDDETYIRKIVREVINENPKIVEDYFKKPKAMQALIGNVMKKTRGQADPKLTQTIMQEELKKLERN
ncbi:MAG: Asp-tRNA(Asn)/Glu-tRNA(Gln) amidotransferase subunit GatB [Promethearchaeota archaeon]